MANGSSDIIATSDGVGRRVSDGDIVLVTTTDSAADLQAAITGEPADTPADPPAEPAREFGRERRPPTATEAIDPPSAIEPVAAPPKPQLGDVDAHGEPKFANYEEFMDATGEWFRAKTVRDVTEQAHAVERARLHRRAHEHAVAQHDDRIEAFKETHADFDTVLASAKAEVQAISDDLGPRAFNVIDRYTVVDAGPMGPAIIHHLAQHPAELRRIAELPPPLQLAALGKIEAGLDGVARRDEPYRTYADRRNREERRAKGLA